MKKSIGYFIGFVFIVLSGILVKTVLPYSQKVLVNTNSYKFLLFGLIGYFILTRIKYRIISDNIRWFRVFSHEITHVVFSVLTFNRIEGFQATRDNGGMVKYHGKGNLLISLSPYCFPLFTIVFLILKQLVSFEFIHIFDFFIGFSYTFHLHTFFIQARTYQPDIYENGYFQSYSFILFFNLFFIGLFTLEILYGLSAFKIIFSSLWLFFVEIVAD